MNITNDIYHKLSDLAYAITDNFCYSCYKVVTGDSCPTCCSDDFMCHLEGVGVEYGIDWVIEHLLEQNCTAIDSEQEYSDLLDELYDEVQIGCCSFSPSRVLKELDPIAFNIGISEMLDDPDRYYEYNGDYYHIDDVEATIDDLLSQL